MSLPWFHAKDCSECSLGLHFRFSLRMFRVGYTVQLSRFVVIALFLANFYRISYPLLFVNHFFIFFSDFRVFWKNTSFSPRHASLPKNNLPPTTIPQQPVGFLIIVYSISNIKQKLFLSCFCCVSFVSSDLYIIAHLELFVNTFLHIFQKLPYDVLKHHKAVYFITI